MRLIALIFLTFPLMASEASAADLYLKYKLYALGLPIGSGDLRVDFGEETYSVSGNGQTAAFGKLVSDGKGSVEVKGAIRGKGLSPESYAYRVKSEGETETIAIETRSGKIGKVSVNPPQDKMNQRIKVTAKHLKDVLDPLSAAVLPAPNGLSKESCNRTLRLYDGKERYNVHLSYKSRRSARTSDGRFKGDVLVCRARYEPIAGHRPKRKTIQELADNKTLEVWLAPAGNAPYLVPLRASIKVAFGQLVVEAEKYKLSK